MKTTTERVTLEQVAIEFKIWRDSKLRAKERTPHRLWELVRLIEPYYRRRQIEVTLSITKEQLDREAPASNPQAFSIKSPQVLENEFITLSVPDISPIRGNDSGLIIAMNRVDGVSLTIENATLPLVSECFCLFFKA